MLVNIIIRDFIDSDSELVEDELVRRRTVEGDEFFEQILEEGFVFDLPSVVRRKSGFNAVKYSST